MYSLAPWNSGWTYGEDQARPRSSTALRTDQPADIARDRVRALDSHGTVLAGSRLFPYISPFAGRDTEPFFRSFPRSGVSRCADIGYQLSLHSLHGLQARGMVCNECNESWRVSLRDRWPRVNPAGRHNSRNRDTAEGRRPTEVGTVAGFGGGLVSCGDRGAAISVSHEVVRHGTAEHLSYYMRVACVRGGACALA
jgi:hypothetical protein